MTVANLAQMFAPAIFKEHEPMMVLRPSYSSAASIWSNSDGCCSTKFVSRSLQSLASYRRKKGDSQVFHKNTLFLMNFNAGESA